MDYKDRDLIEFHTIDKLEDGEGRLSLGSQSENDMHSMVSFMVVLWVYRSSMDITRG